MSAFRAEELAAWCDGVWDPVAPSALQGVSNDSRSLVAGNLYVALKGGRFDGHAFIGQAFQKGAAGAVVEAACPLQGEPERPLLRVADPAQALRNMAEGYRRKMGIEIVAVTGSAGKSTVKEMLADMLTRAMPTARTKGNWNNEIGLPLSVLAMAADTRVGVFEVGISHPGEMPPLAEILQPTSAVVTNVGPVHIEFFDSVEDIAKEKARLLEGLPTRGWAVLNRDGGCFEALRAACRAQVVSVAAAGSADYICVERRVPEQTFVVRETASGEEVALRMSLPGRHNVTNAMLALALARRYGVSWALIGEALERHQGLPMRWQETCVGGLRIINDAYNANPLSMRMAAECFRETPVAGRKWLVIAGMLELGRYERDEHWKLGESLADGGWEGLFTVGRLGALVAAGAKAAGLPAQRIWECANNRAAAEAIRREAGAGDAVLLKASRGMGLEEVVSLLREGDGREYDPEYVAAQRDPAAGRHG